jgi:8-oxo-dGTP pyrophosphatase MutT (NUDIX family)
LSAFEGLFPQLRERLGAHAPSAVSLPGVRLRESAVLVPLFLRDGEPYVVFTQRHAGLRRHAGQISFPGGARDPEDPTPLHAALRETHEEIGLAPTEVDVLGALDEIPTVTGFRIQPFVGRIPPEFEYRLSAHEIAELIEAPLSALLRPEAKRVQTLPDRPQEKEVYFFDYGPHVIWGATARILNNLFQLAGDLPAFHALRNP